jgi:RNA polymerase sigma-70 factor (ECF subfamily)
MMQEFSDWLSEANIPMAEDLDREFESRLAESSTLAFRVAYGVLRHREDAEDVAQEAFAKAYRSFRTMRERDRFRSWLVRITWRLAINRYRSNKRRLVREQVPDEIQFQPTAADSVALNERNARLWKAIDALPEKLRIVTVLAGIEEHDLREVARLLGIPEGTVKSRMFLARQRLKEMLQ